MTRTPMSSIGTQTAASAVCETWTRQYEPMSHHQESDMIPMSLFPCVCCGHLVHDQLPGSHQVCPICGWEDDLAQLRFPEMPGSSNTVSLAEAQRNFQTYGASERRNRARPAPPPAPLVKVLSGRRLSYINS